MLLVFFAPVLGAEMAGFVQCDPTAPIIEPGSCNLCALLKSVETFINWMITVSIPLAVGFIVYGAVAIMIAGGSPERVQKGRESITRAVIGAIIVLTAWLLVNEIMQLLVGQSLNPWHTITC